MDRRLEKRKRIFFPDINGQNDQGHYVDLPIIATMPIIGTQAQVLKHKFANDPTNESRTVVTKRVKSAGFDGETVTYNSLKYLDVERLQIFRITGSVDIEGLEKLYPAVNAQLYKVRLNNKDPAPRTPEDAAGLSEDDIGHYKVHYVRFYKDNNDNGADWITVEYIDQMQVLGTNGQIFKYKFKHPTADDYAVFGSTSSGRPYGSQINDDRDPYKPILGYCDPDLELMESDPPETAPWRLDPLQNIVNVGGNQVTLFWAYLPESILPGPRVGGGYHFSNAIKAGSSITPPSTITLSDGRTGVITGNFPVVQDVIFNPGAGVDYLAFPWWIIGPNTDNSSGNLPNYNHTANVPGYNYYDISGPSGSFSRTWPFFGYTYSFGEAPAHFAPAGSLSVSFGPISLTVDGVPWTLTNTHVAFTAIPESAFGATPTNMGWQPFFSVTFEPA